MHEWVYTESGRKVLAGIVFIAMCFFMGGTIKAIINYFHEKKKLNYKERWKKYNENRRV